MLWVLFYHLSARRPGGLDPIELEKEYGDSVDFLCARLKLAHSEKQVSSLKPGCTLLFNCSYTFRVDIL